MAVTNSASVAFVLSSENENKAKLFSRINTILSIVSFGLNFLRFKKVKITQVVPMDLHPDFTFKIEI